ncbi:MAG: primosomal protein N' [Planctomycetota bacterium]|nr:primosomal protein N' [Planctomycetota bacterium]
MFAQVVLPVPIDKPFTYSVPAELRAKLSPGARVRVPFGKSVRVGYCVGFSEATGLTGVKDIKEILDAPPLVDEQFLRLARWVADYYVCSWGQALEMAIPAPVRSETTRRTEVEGIELAVSQAEAQRLMREEGGLTGKQKAVLAVFSEVAPDSSVGSHGSQCGSDAGVGVAVGQIARMGPNVRLLAELSRTLGVSTSPVRRLVEKGILRSVSVPVVRDPFADLRVPPQKAPVPTSDQQNALNLINGLKPGEPGTVLIHGVTGSGKTEIYIRAIEKVVSEGKQAIVLVPEVALTPQMVTRFRARFGRVAVFHSYMTEAQRHGEWMRIRDDAVDVVIGARSAVFAPTRRLGLIVVDEEHESSYKADSSPRYNARDVAVVRGRMEGAIVLLGSATPSLESHHNWLTGKYHRIFLPTRIEDRPLPPVEIIDMSRELTGKGPFPIISRQLELRVREALRGDGRVILFLNRRGFFTMCVCGRCGYVARCKRCQIALTYHKQYGKGLCHYCGEQQALPARCPECAFPQMRQRGTGTEKVQEEAARLFGECVAARVDSDSMKSGKAYRKVLTEFVEGDVDMLVGTQVIAKGLDIPDVTLVGIVSGDTCLLLKDFRCAERTLQLIMQVAGRSGRGPKGGRVVVQTYNPQHYAIRAAATHDYDGFAEHELSLRREFGFPPFGRLVRIVVQGKRIPEVRAHAEDLVARLKRFCDNLGVKCGEGGRRPANLEVLGPAPAPIERKMDKYRWHILLRSPDSALLHDAVRSLGNLLLSRRTVSVAVDVDPVSML